MKIPMEARAIVIQQRASPLWASVQLCSLLIRGLEVGRWARAGGDGVADNAEPLAVQWHQPPDSKVRVLRSHR